jgi:hypothetical protein
MVDKEHASLTGASLHEPKGIAAAAANRVYLSNGAASGSWTTVPSAAIDAAGTKVFQSQLYHVRDQVSSGTSGASNLTINTWNTRRLNTEVTDEITASIASNQISLVAGTYRVLGHVMSNVEIQSSIGADTVVKNKLRLRNITDGVTLILGLSYQAAHNSFGSGVDITVNPLTTVIKGTFTLSGSKVLELQEWFGFTGNVASLTPGKPASSGEDEVYADLMIWKLS